MKKIVASALIIFVLLFSNCITVFASNHIDGTDLTPEITLDNRQKIMDYASEHLKQEINESNIFFDQTYKVYLDVYELLDYDVMTEDLIKELRCKTDAVFRSVPVYGENETITVWLAPDNENNGDFYVTGGEEDTERFNHIEFIESLLEKNGVNDANVYLFGGVNGNLRTIAAVCRGNEDVQFLILNGTDENDKMYSDLSSDSRLYSYNEIKYIASLYTYTEGYDGGGGYIENNNLQYALIAGGAVLGLCAVALIINFASKKKVKV